jgi:3-carboxy-cis,cis-muconate cycloisomerase
MNSTARSPAEIDALFLQPAQWQSWLTVEAALARAQADVGMLPAHVAANIESKANLSAIDSKALAADIAVTRAPVLSLVHALAEACGDKDGGYVHWGATTQNIILTGKVLQIRKMHDALLQRLAGTLDAMAAIAREGEDMVMTGRTNRQPALPITFGFKVAGWIEEFLRFETRFSQAETRLFVLAFGGAIGAMQSFGEHGEMLSEALGRRLNLTPVHVPTRAMVDHFVEYILLLAQFGTTCGRVAKELYTLMSPEFGEVFERQAKGVRGSSTLPQKVNPKLAMDVISSSTQLRACVTPALEAAQPSHEGDAATNQVLYATLDTACPLAFRVLHDFELLLTRIELNRERMAWNIEREGPGICAENVMMRLAPVVGRQAAHDQVHAALQAARTDGQDVLSALLADADVRAALGEETIRNALRPQNYTGTSRESARTLAALADEGAVRLRSRAQAQD